MAPLPAEAAIMIPFAVFAEQAATAGAQAPLDQQVSVAALALVLLGVAVPAWLYVAIRVRRGRSPLDYEDRQQVPWTGGDVLAICGLSFLLQMLPLAVLRWQGFELPQQGKLPAGSQMSVFLAQAEPALVRCC